MSSLLKIEAELRETEAEILACYDMNTGEELEDPSLLEERKTILHNAAVTKRDHYAKILKDGFFKRMSDKIDKAIARLKREKEDLAFRKEQIELALHNHVQSNELETMPIVGEDGKPELYITPTLSVTKSIPRIEEVEAKYLRVKAPELPFNDHEYMLFILENSKDPVAMEIAGNIRSNSERRCNVSDLPEDHRAIRRTIRPTIKTTIRKPKDVEEKRD